MNYAGITEVLQLAPLFLPLLERLSPFYLSSTTLLLPSVACFAYFPSTLFSFQGADLPTYQGQSLVLNPLNTKLQSSLVEVIGLEPVTPCLQSRCSTN